MSLFSSQINSEWERVKSFGPLIQWEDLEVGKTYHVPPIYIYKRMDITIEEKGEKSAEVKIETEGKTYHRALYRSEALPHYMNERIEFPKKKHINL